MKYLRSLFPLVTMLIAAGLATAKSPGTTREVPGAATQSPRLFVLLITGIGGETFYTERFNTWSDSTVEVLTEGLGVPPAQIVRLAPAASDKAGRSSREAVLAQLKAAAAKRRSGDRFVLWYIGHATARGSHLALNLPGPDLKAEALAVALEAFGKNPVLVVLGAAATGAMVPVLSAPHRLIITATASAAEQHAPLFAGPFTAAFASPAADTDKDRRVSVLEAFIHANHEVRASYKRDGLLVVEHALLDDNADGLGTRAEQLTARAGETPLSAPDGLAAARWFLDIEQVRREVGGDPKRLRLRLAARALVSEIEQLKREKQKYFADDFDTQLETLLVELALNRRAYRLTLEEGKKP